MPTIIIFIWWFIN